MESTHILTFQDKSLPWFDRFEAARVKASSWCSLSKLFTENYSIQDLCLNWNAFILQV